MIENCWRGTSFNLSLSSFELCFGWFELEMAGRDRNKQNKKCAKIQTNLGQIFFSSFPLPPR